MNEEVMQKEISRILDEPSDWQEKIRRLQRLLSRASDLVGPESEASILIAQNIEELLDKNRTVGLSTGLADLDRVVGGIKSGHCYVLAANTGMGKSLLALNILVNLAKDGTHTVYFDLENGIEPTLERILRIWYALPEEFFKSEDNKEEIKRMAAGVANLDYYNIESLHHSRLDTLEVILSKMETHVEEDHTKLFVVDPLQALEKEARGEQQAYIQIGSVIRQLKDAAQEMKTAVLICHHLRKGQISGGSWVEVLDSVDPVKYRFPTLDDIKGTSKITDYATDVWGLIRQNAASTPEERAKTCLRILKQRTGVEGDIRLIFREDVLTYNSAAPANEVFDGGVG
ncbi:MAG: DnaB-like helicase C-terminal domain-containing protein [bacterium]|nr:DnaB-like helicase C-terminal domain-containing protein [bacterium]